MTPLNWREYEKLFGDTGEQDNAYVAVPIFPDAGFVAGNVITTAAQVARALAGIGKPDEVHEARQWILGERAKLRH
jgi:hypothetical protein